MMPSDDWLANKNKEYRRAGITPGRRSLQAVEDWARENRCTVSMSSPEATRVFEWFRQNTRPDAHELKPLFTGVYFFDASFWRVVVPLVFGEARVDALDSLEGVPSEVKAGLSADPKQILDYVAAWADILDYGYSVEDLRKTKSANSFATGLLLAGHGELKTTVSQLLEQRPNPKAIESARMATEMHLKAYLAYVDELDENQAMKLSHNLERSVSRCLTVASFAEVQIFPQLLDRFPSVAERYLGKERSDVELWRAYQAAQFVATSVLRPLSGRDVRPTLTVYQTPTAPT
jgi:hypothetical protein